MLKGLPSGRGRELGPLNPSLAISSEAPRKRKLRFARKVCLGVWVGSLIRPCSFKPNPVGIGPNPLWISTGWKRSQSTMKQRSFHLVRASTPTHPGYSELNPVRKHPSSPRRGKNPQARALSARWRRWLHRRIRTTRRLAWRTTAFRRYSRRPPLTPSR
jgi:hypothetical protein